MKKAYRECLRKYNMAEHRGALRHELKDIYIELAASYDEGIDLDLPIYRVIKINNLIRDYRSGLLTFPQISKETWGGKSGENPLKLKKHRLADGTIVSVDNMMDDYYGSCWSLISDSSHSFREFNQNQDSVRIKSTIRKVFKSLICEEDIFFNLHYHVRAISYKTQSEMEQWVLTPLSNHLDSMGIGLIETLSILPCEFAPECEVRFIYLYQPKDNSWVQANVKVEDKRLCCHPFDWKNVIDSIEFDFSCDLDRISDHKSKLRQAGINEEFEN